MEAEQRRLPYLVYHTCVNFCVYDQLLEIISPPVTVLHALSYHTDVCSCILQSTLIYIMEMIHRRSELLQLLGSRNDYVSAAGVELPAACHCLLLAHCLPGLWAALS